MTRLTQRPATEGSAVWRRLAGALVAASVLAACGGPAPQPRPAPPPAPRRTLQIGLIPEQNVFTQLERYEPLAAYLGDKVGVKVELRILPRYGNIIDNFNSAHLDGAFFGSFTYALAHRKLGVTVLARPVGADGVSTYHGLILVRRDSGIRSIREMRGKRFAFVDKATTAGYLLPLDFFATHGVKQYRSYLRETYFAGTHEDVIYDVLTRKADIGAAKNTVLDRLARQDSRVAQDLLVLATSPEVPENGLAVKDGLGEMFTQQLQATLVAMPDDPRGRQVLHDFGASRFIVTTDADYAPVYAYAREIGLDLATYDYLND